MAPVSYNFNANKPSYHSSRNDGGKRRILIFVCLTIIFAGLIYFVFFGGNPDSRTASANTDKTENPAAAPAEGKDKAKPLAPTAATQKPPLAPPVSGGNKTATPVPYTPQSFPQMETLLRQAEAAFAAGDYKQTRELCNRILASRKVPDNDPLWEKTAAVLGNANVRILFSDYPFPEKKAVYQVKPNDGLRKIAMDHNTSMEAVQKSNKMKATDFNVQLGQTMNIYVGDWKIIASKSRRKLYLFDGKDLFKVYNIGIGKQDRTPLGVFATGTKTKNPDWYSPKGKIPFGDKNNVLGTRWIQLIPRKCNRRVSGLGIHGTWAPDSIGKAESNGCLRLLNPDIEELFAILPNEAKPISVIIME
ncbi:MAG: L,D-transpeptidase family protein [Victivallales bacterium]|nr:L,D-transpeptidase family protein [Victivallales bacterium]